MLWLNDLLQRKHELGLSNSAIACRSGVSKPTVNRVLAGKGSGTSITNVQKIAESLKADIRLMPTADVDKILSDRARKIAQKIVTMVQGSSGLEAQAVSPKQLKRMVSQTVHELMAGPKQRLWDDDQ